MPPPSDNPPSPTPHITAQTTLRDLLAAAREWGMTPDEFYRHARRDALASAITSNRSTSSTLHSRSRS